MAAQVKQQAALSRRRGVAGMGSLLALGTALAVTAARLARRPVPPYRFTDKIVLITGSSRGLGLLLARELAAEHARLVLCAREAGELERARGELEAGGAQVMAIPCDLTCRASVDRLVDTVVRSWGDVDVLFNNAGTIAVGPMELMLEEDYERAMAVHFWGPLWTILAVLPGMRRQSEGRIVNISSIGGQVSVPHLLPYCASKFALTGLSEGLRAALRRDGIRVTTVHPGLMRTGSARNADFKGRHRAEHAWFSLGASLPGVSMNAGRAARQIIEACRRGDAEVVPSLPAKALATFHGLFPGLTADALGVVNRFLPGPGGVGARRVKGRHSGSIFAPSPLTALGDRAAERNNE